MEATSNSNHGDNRIPITNYGMYRSKDPIQNFKMRVRLERTESGIGNRDAKEQAKQQDDPNEVELSQMPTNEPPNSEVEECTFSWQEKVFSQREYEFYSNEINCPGSVEKKYHCMIDRMRRRRRDGRPTNRLFTYTDVDSVFLGNVTTLPNERRTYPERDTSTLRQRPVNSKATLERKEQSLPLREVVNYEPTDAQRKQWHGLTTPVTTMHIMADVATLKGEDTGEAKEVVLCSIRVDGNGAIAVSPDFNAGQKPYKLETGNLGRDVYFYTLEHASNFISAEEKEQEAKMFRELYSRHSASLATQVGHEFQEIQADMLRLHVFGEIVSAEGFEYDGLYVNFFVELPGNWTAEGGEPLHGVTQACATKCIGSKNMAHFSFPFTYQLICPLECLTHETTENLPRWPQLCFQVMSRDTWNRFRTEGYGYVNIPSVPGMYSYRVGTWRPVVRSLGSQLRRYFVGGSPELEDLSVAAITSTFQDKCLSKYGMRTESSGTIAIRIQSVQQCQEFSSLEYRQRLGHLTDKLRLSTLQSSVAAVLEAFQRARRRMLAAREDLHL